MRILTSIIKKNWQIILIVGLSLFLRLFRISSYMTFLGDEGRDSLVWLRMVTLGKFTLIGPQTSIGNMYLGPLYYYLMLPFYAVLGTIGPSVGVALFAGATTGLLWYCGKNWFSERVGIVAAFLYAISPVAVILSRSSWNPNVIPFFSILTIWGVWQFWQKDRFLWLTVVGITLSFAIQSHYLGILLVPIAGFFWLIRLIRIIRSKDKLLKKFVFHSVLCALCFVLLTIVPLVWFDLRHNFINYNSFYKFFSERQTTVNLKLYKAIPQMWPLWQTLVTRLVAGKNEFFGFWLSLCFGGLFIVGAVTSILRSIRVSVRDCIENGLAAAVLLSVWLLIGLAGMGLYKQHVYDHYFGFLYPAIFLFCAVVLEKIFSGEKFGKIISVVIFLILLVLNFANSPLITPPGKQMEHTAEITKKIISESENKPFNLGMIAKQNYDAGYRYFLEKSGNKAVEIDAQRSSETITDQLFVVCEEKDCQPINHPQAEIANFGWVKIENVWEFPWGVKLFKLVHNR